MELGHRTLGPATRPGARSPRGRLRDAVAMVLGDPVLWLFGALGFASRGGLVLLALPIVTIPSPVTLTIVFRSALATSGDRTELASLAFVSLLALGLLLLCGLLLAAYADAVAYERVVADPGTQDVRGARPSTAMSGRRRIVLWLAGVQAAALVPAGVAISNAAAAAERAVRAEAIQPGDLGTPLVLRIGDAVRHELLLVFAAVAFAEIVYAVGSRRILAVAMGAALRRAPTAPPRDLADRPWDHLLRRLLATLATALLGWLVSVGILLPVAWSLLVTWSAVRGLYLSPVGATGVDALAGGVLVTVALVVLWMAAIVLAGFSSALRAAIWTAHVR